MNNMFHFYESLSSLPDISKWNTQKVINKKYIYDGYNTKLNNKKIKK